MDDDEGYIQFGFNDRDLDEALNPGQFRSRRTKDDQIYGIWADRNEEDDEKPAFGKSKPNHSAPVRFVSGGVSVGNKMEDEDEEDEDEPAPSTSKRDKLDDDVVEVSVFGKKPTSFGAKKVVGGGFAGMRTTSQVEGTASTLHSMGNASVIMKMMKKMGYESGKGLGARKQGIVEPVVSQVRKGRGAVGAYGAEQKGPKFGESAADAQKRNETGDDVITLDPDDDEPRAKTWKRSTKVRVKYKTLHDVIEDGGLDPVDPVGVPKQKVVDYTGPQEKTYDDISSYHRRRPLREPNKRPHFDVPALTQNLNTLLGSCEHEILRNHTHLEDLRNRNRCLERDQAEMKHTMDESRNQVDRMSEVIKLVKSFDAVKGTDMQKLDAYRDIFIQLTQDFPVECSIFNIDCVIQYKVMPLMAKLFSHWNPLDPEQTDQGLDEVAGWRQLLRRLAQSGVLDAKSEQRAMPVYDLLLWEGWMPAMRRAALQWDARLSSPQMTAVLQCWMPQLPGWLVDNLFDQLIIPRIAARVAEWDPVTDQKPLDAWLVPWHEMLGDRLLDVYSQVRQKMAVALRRWTSTDLSAVAVVKPWHQVFSKKHMADFLEANIVPKLEQGLQKMNLNPMENTTYAEFHGTLAWRTLMADAVVCRVLTRNFFSRWYENVLAWLHAPGDRQVIVQDVANYYREWKARVPDELHAWPQIQTEFARAIKAIGQAKRGEPVERLQSYEDFGARSLPVPQPAPPPPPAADPPTITQKTLKHYIEQVAHDKGLLFVPVRQRHEHGRQVYTLGKRTIYLDGTAVLCMDFATRQWHPIPLGALFSDI